MQDTCFAVGRVDPPRHCVDSLVHIAARSLTCPLAWQPPTKFRRQRDSPCRHLLVRWFADLLVLRVGWE